MGIELLSGFGRVQPYYRASEITNITPAQAEENKQQSVDLKEASSESVMQTEDRKGRTTDPKEISLTFNKEETFDYIGSESGLMNLDVQKAISDMKKDAVLQEYQYFVGSSQNILDPKDGLVFQK